VVPDRFSQMPRDPVDNYRAQGGVFFERSLESQLRRRTDSGSIVRWISLRALAMLLFDQDWVKSRWIRQLDDACVLNATYVLLGGDLGAIRRVFMLALIWFPISRSF
jgi:hypothetical protein